MTYRDASLDTFSNISPTEIITLGVDFAADVAAPVPAGVSVAMLPGVQAPATPADILQGSAQVSGTYLFQRVGGCADMANYALRFAVTDANGNRFEKVVELRCRALI